MLIDSTCVVSVLTDSARAFSVARASFTFIWESREKSGMGKMWTTDSGPVKCEPKVQNGPQIANVVTH